MHEAVRENTWTYSARSDQWSVISITARSKPSIELQQLARMFGVGVPSAEIVALHSSQECLASSRALGTSMSTFFIPLVRTWFSKSRSVGLIDLFID